MSDPRDDPMHRLRRTTLVEEEAMAAARAHRLPFATARFFSRTAHDQEAKR